MQRLLTNGVGNRRAIIAFNHLMNQRLMNAQCSAKSKRRYTTAEPRRAATTTRAKQNTISWQDARPFEVLPSIHPLRMMLNFLPGGRYANKDLNGITKAMLEDTGDIMVIKGLMGKKPIVLTQNPDDFEIVYRHDGNWPRRKGFEVLNYHRNIHRKDYFGEKKGLLTSQGKEWGDFRSAVNPILIHPKNVKVYLPAMAKISQQFIERIRSIRDRTTLEVPGNFKDEISCWTLESVAVIALDQHLNLINGKNPEGKQFFDILQRFFTLSVELEVKPSLWRIMRTAKLAEALAVLDEGMAFTDKYIQQALQRLQQTPSAKSVTEQSVLEKLIAIDSKLASIMAMDMLFAAVDTTTTAFAGLLLALAKHPEKQQKLRQEIIDVLPTKDAPLTEEKMSNLPYLRACIKESLRYYPVTQANVRTAQEDLVLSGYRVPQQTEVALVHLNLFRDSKHFSRPDEFIPERWLRDAKDTPRVVCPREATKTSHPFAYLPFGFGARSCIGRRIAEMEVEIGIARILRNFNVEFNYPTENAFMAYQINTPNIPLKFKFTDLSD